MSNGFQLLCTTTTTSMYNRIQRNATVRTKYLSVAEKQPVSYADRTLCGTFKHHGSPGELAIPG